MTDTVSYVAIDVGSGYVKAIAGKTHISFQSIASPFPNDDFFKAQTAERILIGDTAWIIGDSAINSARKEDRSDTLHNDWAGSDGWVALLFAALSKLQLKGKIELITGIPQAQFADKIRRNEIISALIGKHTFEWMGLPTTIDITNAMIIPQAAGAVLCKAAQDETVMQDVVGIVDIGTFTTGFSVMRKGEFMNARSGGHAIGVSNLIAALAGHLEREYSYRMDEAEGPNLLIGKTIKNRGRIIDITNDIAMLARRVAKPMLDAVDSIWKGGNDLTVYVAGGGAPYFIEPLREVLPHAQQMDNNFFAVAQGMAIYLRSQAVSE